MSSSTLEDLQIYKETAASTALQWVVEDCILGVGSGTTAEAFIRMLPDHSAKPSQIISSSKRSTELLTELGLKVTPLLQADGDIDVYVDGADEFTRSFTLVKGGGGCHTHEKLLAGSSRKFVVMVDPSKEVKTLGNFPVPVEVLPQARSFVARKIAGRGGSPTWREGFVTDEGNFILDCTGLETIHAESMELRLASIPGVVDSGLCSLRRPDFIVIGGKTMDEVEVLPGKRRS